MKNPNFKSKEAENEELNLRIKETIF